MIALCQQFLRVCLRKFLNIEKKWVQFDLIVMFESTVFISKVVERNGLYLSVRDEIDFPALKNF
jgi:hypothetical protein